jgi:probable phosphoglycerate mutase
LSLLLIRHGPTIWNSDRRLQGRADIPLSPAGINAVANWRLPESFRAWPARTSPLVRASATAAMLGLPAVTEPDLVEIDWGEWEGRSLAELRLGDPSEVARREALGLDFCAPGGESYRDAAYRIAPLLGKTSILVTHRGMMLAALAVRTGWAMKGPPPVTFEHSDALLIDGHDVRIVPLAPPGAAAAPVHA